jgi:hypothetical protein
MEYGCPVCNGLTTLYKNCPYCGRKMEDKGMVDDYLGPYSPYGDMDLYEQHDKFDGDFSKSCVHLVSCADCGYDTRIGVMQLVL